MTISSASIAATTTNKSASNDSDNFAKEYLSGEFAARDNDFATAAARFETALAQHPNDMVLLQNTYKFMLLSGNFLQATNYAKLHLERDKHAATALIILAIAAVSEGEFSKASAILDNILPGDKTKPIAAIEQLIIPLMRIWIIAGEGNFDVALNILDSKDASPIVSNTFIQLQQALLLSMSGNEEEAAEIFTKLTNGSVILPYNIAKSAANFYQSINKWDEASRIYALYQKQHPAMPHFSNYSSKIANKINNGLYIKNPIGGMAEIMKEMTRLLFSNQLYDEGLVYLQLALMLQPTDNEAIMLLANYYEERSNFSKAIESYNNITTDSDFYVASQVNKAENLYKTNAKQEARKLLLKITESITEKYIPLVTLADLLRRDNQYKDAIKIYDRVLENIDQKNPASWAIFFARGMCYERISQWKKAEPDLQAALKLNPDQPEVVNYLAYSWLEHNQNLEQARDMLLKAAAKRPTDPQILDSAGWALYKLKDYKNAVIFLEKSAELMPQDPVINDHLGDAYWKAGRKYEAQYQWQRAIKYSPLESPTISKLNHKIIHGN